MEADASQSAGENAQLDSNLVSRLALEPGLFHHGPNGERLSRGLTEAPLKALAAAVSPGMRTIETGCGGSTVVLASSGARHTAITPSEAERARVLALCEREGIPTERLDFRIGSSDRVLFEWREPVDLFLIDGAHRFPFPMVDWHYGAPNLRVGGELWIDDVPIPAVHRLFEFLQAEPSWLLLAIYNDKVARFVKLAEPAEDPVRDWELQRYNHSWTYGHVPLRRRWRTWRDRLALRTRLRRMFRHS